MNRLIDGLLGDYEENLKRENDEVVVAIEKCVSGKVIVYNIYKSIQQAIDENKKDRIKRLKRELKLQKKTNKLLVKNLVKQIEDVAWLKAMNTNEEVE